jgi:hypothetical protein
MRRGCSQNREIPESPFEFADCQSDGTSNSPSSAKWSATSRTIRDGLYVCEGWPVVACNVPSFVGYNARLVPDPNAGVFSTNKFGCPRLFNCWRAADALPRS